MVRQNCYVSEFGNKIQIINKLAEFTEDDLALFDNASSISLDCETTGLNPRESKVRLLQLVPNSKDDPIPTCYVFDLFAIRKEQAYLGHNSTQRQLPENAINFFKRLLINEKSKLGHYLKFDAGMLYYELGGLLIPGLWFDTMIMSSVAYNGKTNMQHRLIDCCRRELGIILAKELQVSDWGAEKLTSEQITYAASDAILLRPLCLELGKRLKSERQYEVFKLEQSIEPIVIDTELRGWCFNKEGAETALIELQQAAENTMKDFLIMLDEALPEEDKLPREEDGSFNLRPKTTGRAPNKVYAGFNPGSSKQLIERFTQAGITLPINEKSKHSTDQILLSFIRAKYPIIDAYLTHKKARTAAQQMEKLIEKVETWNDQDYIFWSINQVGTDTGRMSSARPNLQQVPRTAVFRKLFRARPGYKLIVADFSGMELRAAAEISNCTTMINAFRHNADLHAMTAGAVLSKRVEEVTKSERSVGKALNFSMLYGGGPGALQRQASSGYGLLLTLEQAEEYRNIFFDLYPELKQWHESVKIVCKDPFINSVQTKFGRNRFLIGSRSKAAVVDSDNPTIEELEAAAKESIPLDRLTVRSNTMVQGSSADVVKIALDYIKPFVDLEHKPDFDARFCGQIHDEIVLEVKGEMADYYKDLLSAVMVKAGEYLFKQVTLEVEAGTGFNWAEAK